jgi:uncharacterized protein (TIGR03083 family)
VTELVSSLSDTQAATPVAACPGWNVHDVLAHLVGSPEDTIAGVLTGPPSNEQTAAQVARHRDDSIADLLAIWEKAGPEFGAILQAFTVWPGVLDICAHEQDMRGAVGRPGARDNEGLRLGAEVLIERMEPPVPVVVRVEDASFSVGPGEGTPLELTTTRFEAHRFRLGRRSAAQMQAMQWSADPTPVLASLHIMGPAGADLVE